MKVLVSDTSVLIDLDRGALVEATFRLPFEFTVPDLLYERELREHGGPDFVRLGLRVEELDGDGVSLALGYLRRRKSLSLPDSFALALARINAWMLLSGDRGLRELAEEEESCYEQDQLPPTSVSCRDNPARRLAVFPVSAQLPRCGGSAR